MRRAARCAECCTPPSLPQLARRAHSALSLGLGTRKAPKTGKLSSARAPTGGTLLEFLAGAALAAPPSPPPGAASAHPAVHDSMSRSPIRRQADAPGGMPEANTAPEQEGGPCFLRAGQPARLSTGWRGVSLLCSSTARLSAWRRGQPSVLEHSHATAGRRGVSHVCLSTAKQLLGSIQPSIHETAGSGTN